MSKGASKEKKLHAAKPGRLLPGTRPSIPAHMANYVVILKEQASLQMKTPGRKAVYERNVLHTTDFQRKLWQELDERGLRSQVAGIAEPLGFPLITLTCTPEVAQAIRSLPGVETVVQDDNNLGLVS